MAKKTNKPVNELPAGAKMTKGKGWKLVHEKGRERVFSGTLLTTVNFAEVRLAIFSVPK